MKKLVMLLFFIFSYANISPIISIKWLQKHYKDKDLVIIDVRDEKDFNKSHLKNAINIPAFKYLFDTKHNYKLPNLSLLQKIFSKAGINNKSEVVVYGNNELIWAARFYWISKFLGHNNVGILKVGFKEAKNYLPKSNKIFIPKKSNFIPKINTKIFATKLDTYIAINNPKYLIIDGRPKEYYKGLKSLAKRKGHIPSALNYPGQLNYDIKGKGMKSIEELKKIFKNLPKNKIIILYCQDGADAALNFLVLKDILHYPNVKVYEAGWLEWGNDFNLPIEK